MLCCKDSKGDKGESKVRSKMDVVDHSFDNWLAVLQGARARTNGSTKAALDHRVDRFYLPSLPIHTVQPSLSYQVSTRSTGWINQFARSCAATPTPTTNRRNDVHRLHGAAVETSISHHQPLSSSTFTATSATSITPILARYPAQPCQVGGVVTRTSPGTPPHNELRAGAHRIPSLYPVAKGATTPRLIVSTCRCGRKAGSVQSDYLL